MNEFLPLIVLVTFTASVTALLIVGVIRVVVATDRPRLDHLKIAAGPRDRAPSLI